MKTLGDCMAVAFLISSGLVVYVLARSASTDLIVLTVFCSLFTGSLAAAAYAQHRLNEQWRKR